MMFYLKFPIYQKITNPSTRMRERRSMNTRNRPLLQQSATVHSQQSYKGRQKANLTGLYYNATDGTRADSSRGDNYMMPHTTKERKHGNYMR
eukprot:350917-Amphidinium_carterae.2